jgi:drug/metabolite transporter (DMT)-like permease
VTSLVLSALLLGEDPSAFQLAGVGLVVAGLLVANLRRPQAEGSLESEEPGARSPEALTAG